MAGLVTKKGDHHQWPRSEIPLRGASVLRVEPNMLAFLSGLPGKKRVSTLRKTHPDVEPGSFHNRERQDSATTRNPVASYLPKPCAV